MWALAESLKTPSVGQVRRTKAPPLLWHAGSWLPSLITINPILRIRTAHQTKYEPYRLRSHHALNDEKTVSLKTSWAWWQTQTLPWTAIHPLVGERRTAPKDRAVHRPSAAHFSRQHPLRKRVSFPLFFSLQDRSRHEPATLRTLNQTRKKRHLHPRAIGGGSLGCLVLPKYPGAGAHLWSIGWLWRTAPVVAR